MAKNTILKLKEHFENVIAGKFPTDNPTRNSLNISDAKRNLEALIKKHKFLDVKPVIKAEAKPELKKPEAK